MWAPAGPCRPDPAPPPPSPRPPRRPRRIGIPDEIITLKLADPTEVCCPVEHGIVKPEKLQQSIFFINFPRNFLMFVFFRSNRNRISGIGSVALEI